MIEIRKDRREHKLYRERRQNAKIKETQERAHQICIGGKELSRLHDINNRRRFFYEGRNPYLK